MLLKLLFIYPDWSLPIAVKMAKSSGWRTARKARRVVSKGLSGSGIREESGLVAIVNLAMSVDVASLQGTLVFVMLGLSADSAEDW